MAPFDYNPTEVWGNGFYGTTTTTGGSTNDWIVIYPSAHSEPPETPIQRFARKSKAELARQQMRAYLSRFPRQDVSMSPPARPVLAARDPLRHHRQRQVRRTPKLSRLERALA